MFKAITEAARSAIALHGELPAGQKSEWAAREKFPWGVPHDPESEDGGEYVEMPDGVRAWKPRIVEAPPTFPVGPKPSEHELRATFRRALADNDVASARLRTASDAVSRADRLISDIDAEIAGFSVEETAAAQAAGAALAASLASGGPGEIPSPAASAVDRMARADAEQRRAIVTAAREKLAAGLVEAEGDHKVSETGLFRAMNAVIAYEVDAEAQRLFTLEQSAAELRGRLAVRRKLGPPANAVVDGTFTAQSLKFWREAEAALLKNPEFSIRDAKAQ
jgi:hypothetical protein